MELWSDWHNAAIYAAFVRDRPVYRSLNRELARRAELGGARRVLDLACGTGATARACLDELGPEAELVGVDGSATMVEVARAEVQDPRAHFLVAPAAAVAGAVPGSFDRAVCSAAFWQFPARRPVLGALRHLLEPEARFVFNLPAERVRGEPAPLHALQAALARTLEEWTEVPAAHGTEIDPEGLRDDLLVEGFAAVERERWVYRATHEELLELARIPAMIGRMAPSLSPAERQSLLDEVEQRVATETEVEVPWIFFCAHRL